MMCKECMFSFCLVPVPGDRGWSCGDRFKTQQQKRKVPEKYSVQARRAAASCRHMGPLTGARCDSMLRDNSHLFRAMWGAVPWTTQNTQRCWEVTRDAGRSQQDPAVFMDGIRSGAHCTTTNWLLGNRPAAHNELPKPIEHLRDIGRPTFVANYTAPAPALLGFDWSVHQHCSSQLKAKLPYSDFEHAAACVAANRNILWIKENSRVAYNLCRNLEWLSCAARGQLRGQRSGAPAVA